MAFMSAKRVGIITLPGNFNYGNRLQCYAMARAVAALGHEPSVLERERCFPLQRRVYYALKGMALAALGRGGDSPERMRTPGRAEAFGRFAQNIPTVVLPGMGYSAVGAYDVLVVGSDQVWNPNQVRHQEDWYFAKFARPEQRVAVAASLGVDRFSDARQAARVAEGVRGFARISVREGRGAQLIRECCGVEAEVVCDPTLALPAGDWRAVADGRCTPEGTYVLTYLLGGASPESAAALDEATDQGCIPVVALSDRQMPDEPDAGPAEFIDLIDHAAHVVTDSFHAAVFSSILHTPLTIVRRQGGASMFSRLEQLSQTLGIEEKVFGSTTYDLARAGDYGGVDEAIARERGRFMEYLGGCLNG